MAWTETTQKRYRRNAERYESDLTDGEWLLAGPLPAPPSKLGRPRSTDLREVPDAIRYMLATGCRLRAVPGCSALFTTVQGHFYLWCDSGVPERMMDAPPGLARDRAGRGPEPTAAGTGSQPVRTTEMAGPSGYDAGSREPGAADVTSLSTWRGPRSWCRPTRRTLGTGTAPRRSSSRRSGRRRR